MQSHIWGTSVESGITSLRRRLCSKCQVQEEAAQYKQDIPWNNTSSTGPSQRVQSGLKEMKMKFKCSFKA
jgi:hypothetical protein